MGLALRRMSFPRAGTKGRCHVCAIESNDRCEVYGFLGKLKKSSPRGFRKLVALLERTAIHGVEQVMNNPENCKFLSGFGDEQLLEFRSEAKGGWNVRLFGFLDGTGLVICTHGMNKKTDRLPPQELERLVRAHRQYQEAKSAQEITLAEDIPL